MMAKLWRACLAALLCTALVPGAAQSRDAAALRARYETLRDALASNPFGRPLAVESSGNSSQHKGEIFAVIEQPYSLVARSLRQSRSWCDILTLQVNVKNCNASEQAVTAFITRKARDPLESAYEVGFRYQELAAQADYFHVALSAASGPAGTRDYQIRLQAAPLGAERTFMHMSYAYSLGFVARQAMDAYLATSGRDKVGFSIVDRLPDGRPVYVDGVRGVVERSAMRYYLAVEAYLRSLTAPPAQRLEQRLRDWYAGTERYSLQLREAIGPAEYLEVKQKEAGRARAG